MYISIWRNKLSQAFPHSENGPETVLFPLMIMPSQIKSPLIKPAPPVPPTLSNFTLSSTQGCYGNTYLIHFVSSQGTDVSRARRGDNCLLWRRMSLKEPDGKYTHTYTQTSDGGNGALVFLISCTSLHGLLAVCKVKYDLWQEERPKPQQRIFESATHWSHK